MFPLSFCELFGVIFCLIGAHRNEFGRSPRQMRLSNLTARAVQSWPLGGELLARNLSGLQVSTLGFATAEVTPLHDFDPKRM